MCCCCCKKSTQTQPERGYTKFELREPGRSDVHWDNITDAPDPPGNIDGGPADTIHIQNPVYDGGGAS